MSRMSFGNRSTSNTGLLPAIELRDDIPISDDGRSGGNHPGFEIERPKSALHSGDFTENFQTMEKPQDSSDNDSGPAAKSEHRGLLGTSPPAPWYEPHSSLRAAFQSDINRTLSHTLPYTSSIDIPSESSQRPARSRAPSLQSLSSSFVLKPPTSPLAQQSNNDDLDFSPVELSHCPSKVNRRHTLPPQIFQTLKSSLNGNYAALAQAARQPPLIQREDTFPSHGHRPQVSSTSSFPFQASSPPQTPPFGRSRRRSLALEASPIQHASMVGSYEESILRGRMSTTPSKPLDFTASIGALGKGECRPKHPAHVSVGFPAVYYSWDNGSGPNASINDEPSPYVGLIDLEHKLPPQETKARPRRRHKSPRLDEEAVLGDLTNKQIALRKREKQKRRSPSPNLKVGGCYRIPQQGHLQILIKNPNKTAVKLFLVPYDLEGMEPGTKTFIRQRCYSTGPIIEKPLTSRSMSDSVIGSTLPPADPKGKPTLRYLIQVNICCPSRGRFYLYKSIHVVFANRVPDNKESLRNEILWPEPRYSPYKPAIENSPMNNSLGSSIAKSQRRLTYGNSNLLGVSAPDAMDGLVFSNPPPIFPHLPTPAVAPLTTLPSFSTPLTFPKPEDSTAVTIPDAMQLIPTYSPTTSTSLRKASTTSSLGSSDSYEKLSRGEAGYGGVFGRRSGTPEPGEGLLARRLRALDVEKAGAVRGDLGNGENVRDGQSRDGM